jgi:hypothetical protein
MHVVEQSEKRGDPSCSSVLSVSNTSSPFEKTFLVSTGRDLNGVVLRSVLQLQLETTRGTEENEIVFANSIIREARRSKPECTESLNKEGKF